MQIEEVLMRLIKVRFVFLSMFLFVESVNVKGAVASQVKTIKHAQSSNIQTMKDERAQQAREYSELKKSDPMGEIEVKDLGEIACDDQGFPTEEALKQVVISEFFLQKPNTDLVGQAKIDFDTKQANLEQNLQITIENGGGYTARIYSVSIKNQPAHDPGRSILFLKISTQQESAQRLATIQKGAVGRLRIESKYANFKMKMLKKELPIIAWVEKIFKYKNSFGEDKNAFGVENLIEVTHAARGRSAFSILQPEDEPFKLKIDCARAIGAALGSFQNLFMNYHSDVENPNKWRTVCHGDFSPSNIFFDKKTSRVYFIDTESMNLNSPITVDILRFFEACLRFGLFSNSKEYSKIGAAFLKEYIDTFTTDHRRMMLVNYFKSLILKTYKRYLMRDFVITSLETSIIADANKSMQKKYKFSHLEVSVAQGNVDEVEKTLKEKNVADFINQKDVYGNTPLYLAVIAENEEIVTLLCNAGADVNLTPVHDKAVLYHARELGNEKIVNILIAAGASIK